MDMDEIKWAAKLFTAFVAVFLAGGILAHCLAL